MAKEILIVDREIHMLNLLQELLRDRYTIHLENGTIEALQWLHDGNLPDLIITEFDLPYMSGLEFITNLNISGFYNKVPIIVLSAMKGLEVNLSSYRHSVAAYVSKPFNPIELNMAISGVFSRYEFN